MRKDIQISTTTGDIVFKNRNTLNKQLFKWLSESDLFITAQISLPSNFDVNQLYTIGVNIEIPYTPIYKPIKIRIIRDFGGGNVRVVINPTNNSEWFEVYTKLFGAQDKVLYASQLIMVNQDNYLLQLNEGNAYLWSGIMSDMVNINANIQNRNLLLQCIPSNNYRYPTSGVGLIKYLHANLSHSGLAEKLQTEFKDDKVEIINAAFNSYSGDLELDLDFSEADAGV